MFEPLLCCLKGICLHPYTITPAKLAPGLGIQFHLRSENDATTSWLRPISTSDHFIHIYVPDMIKKELMTKNIDMDNASGDKMKESKKTVRYKFLAALMLSGANREKYKELKCSMAENYITGMRKYSESPEVVLCILNAYVHNSKNRGLSGC